MIKKILAMLGIIAIQSCAEETNRLDSSLLKYSENLSLPATIMGYYIKDDDTAHWYAFGPSKWSEADTVSEENIFRIMSMTKVITSVAALQLVERGLIGLDSPLNDLMPQMVAIPILKETGVLSHSNNIITLKHLLTHTSGFADKGMYRRLTTFNYEVWPYEDNPRLSEPGTRWHYGTSTNWIGKIIEKISGQDLETYFRQNITGPLRMDHTWFNVPDSLKDQIVSWGVRTKNGFIENSRIPQKKVTVYDAAGGLFSSPKDFLTFLKCLINEGKHQAGQILKPETVRMMFENYLSNGITIDFGLPDSLSAKHHRYLDEHDQHGLAWAIEANDSEKIRPKGSGYWGGASNTYYSIDKENGLAIVYFNQILPFNDQEAYDFYRYFEREVYSTINHQRSGD